MMPGTSDGRGIFGLHADDLRLSVPTLHDQTRATYTAPQSDGNKNHVRIRKRIENLTSHRPDTRDQFRFVGRMNVAATAL